MNLDLLIFFVKIFVESDPDSVIEMGEKFFRVDVFEGRHIFFLTFCSLRLYFGKFFDLFGGSLMEISFSFLIEVNHLISS